MSEQQRTATIPCSTCGGTGRVFLAAHPVPDLPCLVCKGEGSVPDLMAALQQSVAAAKGARKDGSEARMALRYEVPPASPELREAVDRLSNPRDAGSEAPDDNPHESDGTTPEACAYCGDVWPCAGADHA